MIGNLKGSYFYRILDKFTRRAKPIGITSFRKREIPLCQIKLRLRSSDWPQPIPSSQMTSASSLHEDLKQVVLLYVVMETDSLVTYLAVALLANRSVTSLRTRAQTFVTFKILLLYIAQPSSSFIGTVLALILLTWKIR